MLDCQGRMWRLLYLQLIISVSVSSPPQSSEDWKGLVIWTLQTSGVEQLTIPAHVVVSLRQYCRLSLRYTCHHLKASLWQGVTMTMIDLNLLQFHYRSLQSPVDCNVLVSTFSPSYHYGPETRTPSCQNTNLIQRLALGFQTVDCRGSGEISV